MPTANGLRPGEIGVDPSTGLPLAKPGVILIDAPARDGGMHMVSIGRGSDGKPKTKHFGINAATEAGKLVPVLVTILTPEDLNKTLGVIVNLMANMLSPADLKAALDLVLADAAKPKRPARTRKAAAVKQPVARDVTAREAAASS
jgi:hypothetical protein